jgi:two-component system alkaline phosphatase synthesis response regulator PhoP
MGEEPKKILAVDDDPDILKTIAMMLEVAGYEIVTAGNDVEGIEKAELARPDLILLDVMMPQMDGFAACAKLKSSPQTAGFQSSC